MILAHEEIQHLNLRFERDLKDLHSTMNTAEKRLRESLEKSTMSAVKASHVRMKNPPTDSYEVEYGAKMDHHDITTHDAGLRLKAGEGVAHCFKREVVDEASNESEVQAARSTKSKVGRLPKEGMIESPRRTEREMRASKRKAKPRSRKTVTRSAKRGYE